MCPKSERIIIDLKIVIEIRINIFLNTCLKYYFSACLLSRG